MFPGPGNIFVHNPDSVAVAQYNTIRVQYNTIQYNTIQYNTIKYNTIQYNTIPRLVRKNCNTKIDLLQSQFIT